MGASSSRIIDQAVRYQKLAWRKRARDLGRTPHFAHFKELWSLGSQTRGIVAPLAHTCASKATNVASHLGSWLAFRSVYLLVLMLLLTFAKK